MDFAINIFMQKTFLKNKVKKCEVEKSEVRYGTPP